MIVMLKPRVIGIDWQISEPCGREPNSSFAVSHPRDAQFLYLAIFSLLFSQVAEQETCNN